MKRDMDLGPAYPPGARGSRARPRTATFKTLPHDKRSPPLRQFGDASYGPA